MGGLSTMLNTQLMLFCLMGAGVLSAKLKLVDEKTRAALSELVVAFILPCNIIDSFMVDYDAGLLFSLGAMLAAGVGIQLFCLMLNQVLYRRAEPGRRAVLRYATFTSNAGFLGNPVVEALYGHGALVYASVYLVPLRIMMWSVGLGYFTATTPRQTVKKLARHPCIIATAIGFVLFVTGWRPPVFLHQSISAVGRCTTMMSMLVVGNILAGVKARALFDKATLAFSALRLVGIPAVVFGALLLFTRDAMVIGVAVTLAGMPAGVQTAILAQRYNGDAGFASRLVFVTTLFSVATAPAWGLLVGAVV